MAEEEKQDCKYSGICEVWDCIWECCYNFCVQYQDFEEKEKEPI
jgi:hypothetical protein